MVAQVSYLLYPISEISNGIPMGYSTPPLRNYTRDLCLNSNQLEQSNFDALYTLGVPPICK